MPITRGEVQVILANMGQEPFTIERGMRIAQLVLAPVWRAEWLVVDELDETERGFSVLAPPVLAVMAESSLQEGMLLVDVGNSYLKLTHCNAEGVLGASRKIHEKDIGLSLFEDHPFKHCVLLPGAERAAHRWRALCQQNAEVSLRIIGEDIPAPDLGQYATCGLDRICAGIGAVALLDAHQEGWWCSIVVLLPLVPGPNAKEATAIQRRFDFTWGTKLHEWTMCSGSSASWKICRRSLNQNRSMPLPMAPLRRCSRPSPLAIQPWPAPVWMPCQSAAGFDGVLLTGGGLSASVRAIVGR